jgi:hypothetical protein
MDDMIDPTNGTGQGPLVKKIGLHEDNLIKEFLAESLSKWI